MSKKKSQTLVNGKAGKEPVIEGHSINFIPLSDRRDDKLWHLGAFWFMLCAELTTFSIGFIGIELGLGLLWTILALGLGVVIGTFFTAFHSAQGPKMGMPQMIQSRPQFGYVGAVLPITLGFLILIALDVFNSSLAGSALSTTVGIPVDAAIVISIVFSTLIAIGGYKWMHYVQRYLFFASITLFVIFTIGFPINMSMSEGVAIVGSFRLAPFIAVFVASSAYQIGFAPYVSDYSRYFPPDTKTREAVWWTYLGLVISGFWLMSLGALVATATETSGSPVAALAHAANKVSPAFGTAFIFFSALPLIAVTGVNIYSSALEFLSITDTFTRIEKPSRAARISIVLISAAVTAILAIAATTNFMQNFNIFLILLGYGLIPWTTVNLLDFYLVRKGHYSISEIFNPRGLYGRFQWRGLTAYGAGFAAMIPFFNVGPYKGPLSSLFGGVDISIFIGLLVSGVLYWIFSRSIDVEHEILKTSSSDIRSLKDNVVEKAK